MHVCVCVFQIILSSSSWKTWLRTRSIYWKIWIPARSPYPPRRQSSLDHERGWFSCHCPGQRRFWVWCFLASTSNKVELCTALSSSSWLLSTSSSKAHLFLNEVKHFLASSKSLMGLFYFRPQMRSIYKIFHHQARRTFRSHILSPFDLIRDLTVAFFVIQVECDRAHANSHFNLKWGRSICNYGHQFETIGDLNLMSCLKMIFGSIQVKHECFYKLKDPCLAISWATLLKNLKIYLNWALIGLIGLQSPLFWSNSEAKSRQFSKYSLDLFMFHRVF